MSRQYLVDTTLIGITQKERRIELWAVLGKTCAADPDIEYDEQELAFTVSGEVVLSGGETEQDYAERVAKEVWGYLGHYVEVHVSLTRMQPGDANTISLSQENYTTLMEGKDRDVTVHDAARWAARFALLNWMQGWNELSERTRRAYYMLEAFKLLAGHYVDHPVNKRKIAWTLEDLNAVYTRGLEAAGIALEFRSLVAFAMRDRRFAPDQMDELARVLLSD